MTQVRNSTSILHKKAENLLSKQKKKKEKNTFNGMVLNVFKSFKEF